MEVPEVLNIGVAQMTSTDDVDANFQQIKTLLGGVTRKQVELVCFPENCLYLRLKEDQALPRLSLKDRVFDDLSELSSRLDCALHLGSVPLINENESKEKHLPLSASVFITPQGHRAAVYHKMHLFDIQLEQGPRVLESKFFRRGNQAQILDWCGWSFGQSICYDIRFSDLFLTYAQWPVDVLLVPAAFLVNTGKKHWHILLRARAVESQCFVVASAQAGRHESPRGVRESFGHSLVVDPWGEVLSDQGPEQGPRLEVVGLDRRKIESFRSQLPMRDHRRKEDVFSKPVYRRFQKPGGL